MFYFIYKIMHPNNYGFCFFKKKKKRKKRKKEKEKERNPMSKDSS